MWHCDIANVRKIDYGTLTPSLLSLSSVRKLWCCDAHKLQGPIPHSPNRAPSGKMWRKTYISVLWIWHAEQSSLKFDWAIYNIGPISIFKPRSSPELFVSFGSVVMENKRFSSHARYIKVEGLWGREFLKAWPSRFYSANNSFHYKDLNSIQMALCTTVQICAKIPITCWQ